MEVTTDKLRELAEWRRGKSPIIAKYSQDHEKMFAEIAGRGFLQLPGYAYDAENGLEFAAKMGLSELNFKILSETIDRELKQQSISYDLEYRDAMMAWELTKQVLMSAWEAEYAILKQGMSQDEENVTRLAIEVSRRGIYLIEQKTIIEVQSEGYKTQLATLDGTTVPYEVQLAQQKLVTAQKKLDIIPILDQIIIKELELLAAEQTKSAKMSSYISAEGLVVTKEAEIIPILNQIVTKQTGLLTAEQNKSAATVSLIAAESEVATKELKVLPIMETLVTKEGELLDKENELLTIEQGKAAEYTKLMAAEMELAKKKEALIAPLGELVNVTETYRDKIKEEIITEGGISNEKLLQAESFARKAAYRLEQLTAEIANSYKDLNLMDSKRTLETSQIDHELSLQTLEIAADRVYQQDLLQNTADIIEAEKEGDATVRTNKITAKETEESTKTTHASTINTAEGQNANYESQQRIRKDTEITEKVIAPEAIIRAALTHLIGQE